MKLHRYCSRGQADEHRDGGGKKAGRATSCLLMERCTLKTCVCDRTDRTKMFHLCKKGCSYLFASVIKIVQHHIISHMTPGQSFIPTPHLNCPVKLKWTNESKSWKHTATTNDQQSHWNLRWNTRIANNASLCHGTFHSLKYSSLPFKITSVCYTCHTNILSG